MNKYINIFELNTKDDSKFKEDEYSFNFISGRGKSLDGNNKG
jgi:hypothetical protein